MNISAVSTVKSSTGAVRSPNLPVKEDKANSQRPAKDVFVRHNRSDADLRESEALDHDQTLTGGEKTLYEYLRSRIDEIKAETEPSSETEVSAFERIKEEVCAYEKGGDSEKDPKSFYDFVNEQLEQYEAALREKREKSDAQMSAITNKLNSGSMLTPSEKQYLMAHDPVAYQNMQNIESERAMYSKMLGCCRTKDDVNALRLSNSLSALAELKRLQKSRNSGDVMSSLGVILQRNAALERETTNFVRSGRYNALPTVGECHQFAKELQKARKYELEKKRAEAAARRKSAEAKRKAKKYRKTPGDGKRTVAQVMRSPLARKVRRSMAKSTCICRAQAHIAYAKGRSRMNTKV